MRVSATKKFCKRCFYGQKNKKMRKDVKDRIEDLATFLDEQTQAVTEYSDALVRRLIERITVYDEMLVVEFKSGLEIEVDA